MAGGCSSPFGAGSGSGEGLVVFRVERRFVRAIICFQMI